LRHILIHFLLKPNFFLMQTTFFKLTTLALFTGALFVSCGDDEEKEPEKVPVEIVPAFPAEGSTIDMEDEAYKLAGLEFKWDAFEGVTSYILEVADNSDFSNPLVNISGNQTTYLWPSGEIDAKLKALGIAYEGTQTLYWRVQAVNTEDFSESSYKTSSFILKRRVNPGLYGEWLFDTEDWEKAERGNPLELHWALNGDYTKANQFEWADGPKEGDKALRIHSNGWLICDHGLPLAQSSDLYVSRYTLLFDVKFNNNGTYYEMSCTSLCWYGFGSHGKEKPADCTRAHTPGMNILQGFSFEQLGNTLTNRQIALSNATFISSRSQDDRQYVPMPGDWVRVVLAVDLKSVPIRAEVWLDGVKRVYPTDTQLSSFTDDMTKTRINWLPEGVVLFPQQGEANMLSSADYARVAIWDYALTEDEIVALGVAGDPTTVGQ